MSADESFEHEPGCSEVYAHLLEYLDSEMTEADATRMRHHLETCSPCLAELSVEEIVRQVVRRSCTERAPEGLRLKVLAQVRSISVTVD